MKRFVWIIVIAVFAINSCKEHQGYTIKGDITGANRLKVVLYKITPDSIPVKIDSCIIRKGKFELKGIVEFPEYCAIYVGDNGPLLLFVENREIEIVFNLKNMQESKVKGSRETDLFVEFNNKMADFANINSKHHFIDFIDSIPNFRDSIPILLDINDSIKQELVNTEPIQQQHVGFDSIQQQQIAYMKLFTEENLNTIVTAFIVDRQLSYHLQPNELESYINSFDEVNSNSLWVQSIIKRYEIAKQIEIGQQFVDLRMSTPNGGEIAISDYVGKEKYVLIYFWASWCGQSRKANPELVKLYNKYKEKELEIIGVSLDKNRENWTKAIETDELTWLQMSDLGYLQSEAVMLYQVHTLPYTVLLDKEGKILAKGIKIDEIVISD